MDTSGARAAPVQAAVTRHDHESGVTEIIVSAPPVNALPVRAWHELAGEVLDAGRDRRVRAVVLRAEGRGFNAGVDIKELQADGHAALVAVNRGCAAAFASIYRCEVPVIAAVHGFCLGGGVGLAGNADIVVASDDAYFGLPEVDRGALGAATHLARLVPQHLLRAMVYTCRTVTAAELHRYGSVLEVVPPGGLRDAALRVAGAIAGKDPYVIRRAKESLNGIDPADPELSYRFEQGFTFELTLAGPGDRHRAAFVSERTGGTGGIAHEMERAHGMGSTSGASDAASAGSTSDAGSTGSTSDAASAGSTSDAASAGSTSDAASAGGAGGPGAEDREPGGSGGSGGVGGAGRAGVDEGGEPP